MTQTAKVLRHSGGTLPPKERLPRRYRSCCDARCLIPSSIRSGRSPAPSPPGSSAARRPGSRPILWAGQIARLLGRPRRAREAFLSHANTGPPLAEGERLPKASDELRRIAAQLGGIPATSSPAILWLLRQRGYALPAATENL